MTPLMNCPKELQLSIFETLPFRDLSSISMASKTLRLTVEPLLYFRIVLKWDKTNTQTPPIVPFLRTIISRPGLATFVRQIYLEGNDFHEKPGHWNMRPPTVSTADLEMDHASQLIRETKISEADIWIRELQTGNMDAVVALLFSQLPKLQSIHFQLNFTVINRWLGIMLRGALCEPSKHRLPSYKDVTKVKFSSQSREYRPDGYQNTQHVLPLFYLPKLHSLLVAVDSPAEFRWPSSAPTSTSIRSLDLYRLRESRLRPLLWVLTGIETLKWDLWFQPDLDKEVSKDIVQLDDLASAVCLLGNTLKSLTITGESSPATSYGDYEPPPLEFRGSLDAMASAHNLQRLEIPWALLMASFSPSSKRLRDGVPASVEHLILTDDLSLNYDQWDWVDKSIIAVIEEELQHRQLTPSSLRRLSLQLWDCTQLPPVEERERLELKATQANIQLIWPE
ncbi:hypothetical protein F66182_8709 [Fusarium sp. NRRL 66182]|nr:hypothetical protein F66182_8709 [Fusarium sp. NRRL 66182]